jgi:hypothetical protein
MQGSEKEGRHSRESGNPWTFSFSRIKKQEQRPWIPAFAGMTSKEKS